MNSFAPYNSFKGQIPVKSIDIKSFLIVTSHINMYSSNLFPLFFLSFPLLFPTVFSQNPLFHFCSSQENFTLTSPYASNINTLTNILSVKVPPTGFALSSAGRSPNCVNGLALCRGDVSSPLCKTCVIEASKRIKDYCPQKKAAIIWYDNCLFKYSNLDFFGQIDDENKFYLYNVNDVSDPKTFNGQTRDLLSRLAGEATESPALYATGEMELEGSDKLYGLVQCTRDLSRGDCRKCLDDAISELPSCCDGKRGGRVVGGSCNFRYELYPFVNV